MPPRMARRRSTPRRLVEDTVTEILRRVTPEDPSCLVRASAVCKTWRRIVGDPDFPGPYRTFHRTPPVLGVFRDDAAFVPTTAFRPRAADHHRDCHVLDCRHGRVLLENLESGDLSVWDPITGDEQHLPEIPDFISFSCNGAVLCARGAGCDHLHCRGGPFLVAFVGTDAERQMHACLYSSVTDEWGVHASIELDNILPEPFGASSLTVEVVPAAHVGDALYFIGDFGNEIVQYDLVTPSLSVINPPDSEICYDGVIVMPEEDGGLGFAVMKSYSLHLWSMEVSPDGDPMWTNYRVVDMKMLIPVTNRAPHLSGFVDGLNAIVVATTDDVFTMEISSLQTKKVCKRENSYCRFLYTGFYTPVIARLPSPAASETE